MLGLNATSGLFVLDGKLTAYCSGNSSDSSSVSPDSTLEHQGQSRLSSLSETKYALHLAQLFPNLDRLDTILCKL